MRVVYTAHFYIHFHIYGTFQEFLAGLSSGSL